MLRDETRLKQRRVGGRRDRMRAAAVVAPSPEQESTARSELRRRDFQPVFAVGLPVKGRRRGHSYAIDDDV